jgi:hypothetical protein
LFLKNKIHGDFSPVHQSLTKGAISTHQCMNRVYVTALHPYNSSTLSFFSILQAAAGLNIDADVL